jgi:hypothetical protein
MTKFATFDPASGALNGRYDSAVHTSIPAGAVPLDDVTFFRSIAETDGVWTCTDGKTVTKVMPSAAQLLAAAQATASGAMNAATQAAIYAGFQSSALGKVYTYPAKDTDQQNLAASVLDAVINASVSGYTTPFWCCDSTGKWAYVPHTSAQMIQVGKDGKNAILAALSRNAVAQAAIANATSVATVQAVTF